MAETLRLRIPLLAAGQAQKELTHNEALLALDNVVHACCSGRPTDTPPDQPVEGLAYLCGTAPSGQWKDHAGDIAFWTAGGWRFTSPVEGLQLTDRADGSIRRFLNGQWLVGITEANEYRVGGLKVVGSRQPLIAPPNGGSVIDTQARAALSEIIQALRSHGLIGSA